MEHKESTCFISYFSCITTEVIHDKWNKMRINASSTKTFACSKVKCKTSSFLFLPMLLFYRIFHKKAMVLVTGLYHSFFLSIRLSMIACVWFCIALNSCMFRLIKWKSNKTLLIQHWLSNDILPVPILEVLFTEKCYYWWVYVILLLSAFLRMFVQKHSIFINLSTDKLVFSIYFSFIFALSNIIYKMRSL